MTNKHYILNNGISKETMYSFYVEKMDEVFIWDSEGKKYTDLKSGLWNVSLGYDKILYEEVSNEFTRQLLNGGSYVDISSYNHYLFDVAAEKLLNFVNDPKYNKLIYTNSGSEANEVCLKIVRNIKPGKKIISFRESYHGTFFGSVSISGISRNSSKDYAVLDDSIEYIKFPETLEEEREILNLLRNNSEVYGSFFIEPVLLSAGLKRTSIHFLNELLKTCKDLNILTVIDEVATGVYKTGKKFFYNYLDSSPDLITLSKSINNGITPFGCVLLQNNIAEELLDIKSKHFSTQNGNLLGMIACIKTLDRYHELHSEINVNIKKLNEINRKFCKNLPLATDSLGTIMSITLSSYTDKAIQTLKRYGILVHKFSNKYEEGILIIPPIVINPQLYEKNLSQIYKIVTKYLDV